MQLHQILRAILDLLKRGIFFLKLKCISLIFTSGLKVVVEIFDVYNYNVNGNYQFVIQFYDIVYRLYPINIVIFGVNK